MRVLVNIWLKLNNMRLISQTGKVKRVCLCPSKFVTGHCIQISKGLGVMPPVAG